jgi:hypothetical protein
MVYSNTIWCMIIVLLLIDESDTCIESVCFKYKSVHGYWAP